MSRMFETIKRYHEEGLWDDIRVRNAVVDGFITPAEYEEIVDEPYPEPNDE